MDHKPTIKACAIKVLTDKMKENICDLNQAIISKVEHKIHELWKNKLVDWKLSVLRTSTLFNDIIIIILFLMILLSNSKQVRHYRCVGF